MTVVAPGTRMVAWLEQAWLERYLARQLGPEESDWFEAYMLDKAELLHQVEADSDLSDAWKASPSMTAPEDKPSSDDNDVSRPSAGSAAISTRVADLSAARKEVERARRRPASWLALAAVFPIALAAGWLAHSSMTQHPVTGDPIANPTRVVFDTLRGEDSEARIENGDTPSPYVLVEISVPVLATDVSIAGNGWHTPLRVSSDGFATALVPRANVVGSRDLHLRYAIEGRAMERKLDINLPAGEQP